MASSKPILRAEEVTMREAGAKADALTREARMATNLNILKLISFRGILCDISSTGVVRTKGQKGKVGWGLALDLGLQSSLRSQVTLLTLR